MSVTRVTSDSRRAPRAYNYFNFDDYSHWLDCDWCSADNTLLHVAALDRHTCSGKIRMVAKGNRNLAQY